MEVDLPKEYDVIVVGTGLVECIIAAASARIGKKVLHIDRNDYYGGQWASFTLKSMEEWVIDMTSTSLKQSDDSETKMIELLEEEKSLATCDPGRSYSNIKRQWYIDESHPVECESMATSSQSGEKEKDPESPKSTKEDSASHSGKDDSQDIVKDQSSVTKKEIPSEKSAEKQSWTQEKMMKLSRKFNLDLTPKLLFSRGALVELLISSNIARYAEFKCITRVLTWLSSDKEEKEEEGKLVVVPCSRSDVFTTDSVSLIEKRLLMKLLEFCHGYEQHLDELQEYLDKPFVDFLKSRRQTPNLIHFVTESIAMVDKNVSCREGLEKTKLFLTSLGRYGTTPFLFSMYGCGELPQAFCRLCAVFEGTYVLRRAISSIVLDDKNTCCGLISEGDRFKCSHLVMDSFYSPTQYLQTHETDSTRKKISRGMFVTDKSILPNEKEQLTLLRFPVKGNNLKPVTVMEVGVGAGVCPKDLYCVQMTCEGADAEDDLKTVVKKLFASEEDSSSDKPNVLWSLYFNRIDLSDTDLTVGVPENIHLCSGPDANLDYDSAIAQAQSVFSKMFPEEEFLPRAPDPDEIVFDNAGAEPKQGDNFGSEKEGGEEEKEKTEKEGNEESEDTSAENPKENECITTETDRDSTEQPSQVESSSDVNNDEVNDTL